MSNRPIAARLVLAAVVLAAFGFSIYPLRWSDVARAWKEKSLAPLLFNPFLPRDFYQTFESLVDASGKTPEAAAKMKDDVARLVAAAKKLEAEGEAAEAAVRKAREALQAAAAAEADAKAKGDTAAAAEAAAAVEAAAKELAEREASSKEASAYPLIAMERAANALNLDLTAFVRKQSLTTNRDVLNEVARQAASPINFGLDLRGGAEFVVNVVPKKGAAEGEAHDIGNLRDRVIENLRSKIDKSGLVEPEIAPQGESRISIKVPVATAAEKEKIRELIQMAAVLQFRLVPEDNDTLVSQYMADPEGFQENVKYERMVMESLGGKKGRGREICFVNRHVEMEGTSVKSASVVLDQFGQRQISLEFTMAGTKQFGELTSKNVGRRLAIVLNGVLYSAPVIQSAIFGNASITGGFSQEEAERIKIALECGNVPADVEVAAVFDTDPTLGQESIQSGKTAGVIGVGAVILFMAVYYLYAGLVADIALLFTVVVILGALGAFGATLTLPGIAGIILTLGMAVDANVLIYERIREELDSHKTLANAIDLGYKRAFLTIVDSNLTTLLVALFLYWFGSGTIKGFAITLSIGIIASMFTAVFVTRLMFDILGRFIPLRTMPMFRLFKKTNIKFTNIWRPCAAASAVLIAATVITAIARGSDALSVDFTGGSQMILNYVNRIPIDELNKALADGGFKAKASYKATATEERKLEIVLKGGKGGPDADKQIPMAAVVEMLNKKFPAAQFSGASESSVGGLIGFEFAKNAFLAIIFSFIGMIIYVSLRFEFAYGAAALVALLHDVSISAGVLLISGGEISLAIVAALLTIVGYSVNDTIVVFDRIRENIALNQKDSYKDIIDFSVNQTLSRTVLTSVTVFITALSLYFFGGIAIHDFSLVLCAGVVVGTYSSIFIASPLVSLWHKRQVGVKDA